MVGITEDFLQTAFRNAYYFETGMKTVQNNSTLESDLHAYCMKKNSV
jgi:hypothetical protein